MHCFAFNWREFLFEKSSSFQKTAALFFNAFSRIYIFSFVQHEITSFALFTTNELKNIHPIIQCVWGKS